MRVFGLGCCIAIPSAPGAGGGSRTKPSAPPSPSPQHYFVSGAVRDNGNDNLLAGARVELPALASTVVTTGFEGAFSIVAISGKSAADGQCGRVFECVAAD